MEEGVLTEEQISLYKDTFTLFDRGNDGNIDVSELRDVMQALDERPTDAELCGIMNGVDIDGNGSIDFPEFLTLMSRKIKNDTIMTDIGALFDMFDHDGNGYITASELRLVLQNIGQQMSDEEIELMISEVDIDGDGTIDYDEFVRLMVSDL